MTFGMQRCTKLVNFLYFENNRQINNQAPYLFYFEACPKEMFHLLDKSVLVISQESLHFTVLVF